MSASQQEQLAREYKEICEALDDGNKKLGVLRKAKKESEAKLCDVMVNNSSRCVNCKSEGWRVLRQDVKKRKTVGKNIIKSTFEAHLPEEQFKKVWSDLYSDDDPKYDQKLSVDFYDNAAEV